MSQSSSTHENYVARSVFVGNLPLDADSAQLKQLFSHVGEVIMFRIVIDRQTNTPKGYGFCEFADPKLVDSAVRNLDGMEYKGHSLRVRRADSEQIKQKSLGVGKASDLTSSAPHRKKSKSKSGKKSVDEITRVVNQLSSTQKQEILSQMKSLITKNEEGAKQLLIENPQLAQALLLIQVEANLVQAEDVRALTHSVQNFKKPPVSPISSAIATNPNINNSPTVNIPITTSTTSTTVPELNEMRDNTNIGTSFPPNERNNYPFLPPHPPSGSSSSVTPLPSSNTGLLGTVPIPNIHAPHPPLSNQPPPPPPLHVGVPMMPFYGNMGQQYPIPQNPMTNIPPSNIAMPPFPPITTIPPPPSSTTVSASLSSSSSSSSVISTGTTSIMTNTETKRIDTVKSEIKTEESIPDNLKPFLQSLENLQSQQKKLLLRIFNYPNFDLTAIPEEARKQIQYLRSLPQSTRERVLQILKS